MASSGVFPQLAIVVCFVGFIHRLPPAPPPWCWRIIGRRGGGRIGLHGVRGNGHPLTVAVCVRGGRWPAALCAGLLRWLLGLSGCPLRGGALCLWPLARLLLLGLSRLWVLSRCLRPCIGGTRLSCGAAGCSGRAPIHLGPRQRGVHILCALRWLLLGLWPCVRILSRLGGGGGSAARAGTRCA